jgi:DNA-binding GntR family transcriptional regulator
VAKEIGMSKTPVHQALLELEHKGFVSLMPRKDFKVNVLSAKNISNMFELRRALERAVILKIAPPNNMAKFLLGSKKREHNIWKN